MWQPATRLQKLYLFNRTNTPVWKILFISKEKATKIIGADIERRRRNQLVEYKRWAEYDRELYEPEY